MRAQRDPSSEMRQEQSAELHDRGQQEAVLSMRTAADELGEDRTALLEEQLARYESDLKAAQDTLEVVTWYSVKERTKLELLKRALFEAAEAMEEHVKATPRRQQPSLTMNTQLAPSTLTSF